MWIRNPNFLAISFRAALSVGKVKFWDQQITQRDRNRVFGEYRYTLQILGLGYHLPRNNRKTMHFPLPMQSNLPAGNDPVLLAFAALLPKSQPRHPLIQVFDYF